MSPHYLVKLETLKCSSCTCYNRVVRDRNSGIYPTSTMASKFIRFESSWLQGMRILHKKVFKIRITDLDELKQRLITSGSSWIMLSLRQSFVSGVVDRFRSVMRVLYTVCCSIPHTLYSTGFKYDELGGHSWDRINCRVYFSNNAMRDEHFKFFKVSQGIV